MKICIPIIGNNGMDDFVDELEKLVPIKELSMISYW